MNDDFNTALAIAVLFDLAREVNTYLREPQLDKTSLGEAQKVFDDLLAVLGISLGKEVNGTGNIDGLMNLIIILRQNARSAKNFKTADSIRDHLQEIGIVLEDGTKGTLWKHEGEAADLLEKIMEVIINIRQIARKNKDFKTADLIREE